MSDLEPSDLSWDRDEHGTWATWEGMVIRVYDDGRWAIATVGSAPVVVGLGSCPSDPEGAKHDACDRAALEVELRGWNQSRERRLEA